jgi:hypothetical protein
MQHFELRLQELRESLREGTRDHSLVAALRQTLDATRLEPGIVQAYCTSLFRLYDLSNASCFLTRPPHPQRQEPLALDPLALSIKAVVLRMLASLVAFFNDSPSEDMPHSLIQ